MQHRRRRVSFGLCQRLKQAVTASKTAGSVGKCLLWVAKRRVSFHTGSIVDSCGLYGGK
jgi:hypothetical protein